MKRFCSSQWIIISSASLSFFVPFASLNAQTTRSRTVAVSKTDLNAIIGTVGKREFSKNDVLTEYMGLEPEMMKAFTQETYPQDKIPSSLDRNAYWDYLSSKFSNRLRASADNLIFFAAVEEVAQQRKIIVTPEEIKAKIHANLEGRRKSAELPEGMTDEELSQKFGEDFAHSKLMMRRFLLMDALVLADLDDRLGHPLRNEDFFQFSMIEIEAVPKANGTKTEYLLNDSKAKIEAARSEILSGKATFEEVAKKTSTDGSANKGGHFAPVPRTLLRPSLEMSVLSLKPGEISVPLATEKSYVLLRLDKTGDQLTEKDRQNALKNYVGIRKRHDDALAKMLNEVPWKSTLGEMPMWVKKFAEAQKINKTSSTK